MCSVYVPRMRIAGSVALVTGAGRGIGAEFVRQLSERGAARIYAGVRDVRSVEPREGVEALPLDVTGQAMVAAAVTRARDVQILVNNAGVVAVQPLVGGEEAIIRSEFETNVFGLLRVSCGFAPVLAANGGGAMLNVLSAASWFSAPGTPSYSASKAAAWSLTDGLRLELAGQGTQVLAVHMGPVDTDMGAQVGSSLDMISPAQVVAAALDGLEAGAAEVLTDDLPRELKAGLTADPAERYAAFAG